MFKVKDAYKLELQTFEMMKLFGQHKNKRQNEKQRKNTKS